MAAKIIEIKKYLGRPKKGRGRPIHEPQKYAIWVQVTVDDNGNETIEYDLSHDVLLDTKYGRGLLYTHIGSILADINEDNPELFWEFIEKLKPE